MELRWQDGMLLTKVKGNKTNQKPKNTTMIFLFLNRAPPWPFKGAVAGILSYNNRPRMLLVTELNSTWLLQEKKEAIQ